MQHEIINYDPDEFYKKSLINPPKDNAVPIFGNDTTMTRIVVDSRVRNVDLYPNQNNYEIQFEDDVNDVKSAKLVYADIPMPQYMINSNFNKIHFKISTINYTATLPTGDYTPETLATAMTAAMNAIVAATFNVTYDIILDNFNFNANSVFEMIFINIKNPLSYLLGFSHKSNYNSITDSATPSYPNLVKSQYRRNFNYNNYLIMDIEQFDLLKSIDRDLNKTFAIIPTNYNKLNICDKLDIVKHFSPPIGRLTKLRIKIYDRFGNPYDFQNMDHHFEIILTGFKQRRKYIH
jgi:hypothetical protein